MHYSLAVAIPSTGNGNNRKNADYCSKKTFNRIIFHDRRNAIYALFDHVAADPESYF